MTESDCLLVLSRNVILHGHLLHKCDKGIEPLYPCIPDHPIVRFERTEYLFSRDNAPCTYHTWSQGLFNTTHEIKDKVPEFRRIKPLQGIPAHALSLGNMVGSRTDLADQHDRIL